MQRIKARAATSIYAGHLFHHQLGVGKYVKRRCFATQSELQSFEERDVLGHIVVLVTDPFPNPDRSIGRAVDHHSNTRRTGVPERTAINVCNEIGEICHLQQRCATSLWESMHQSGFASHVCDDREIESCFPQKHSQKSSDSSEMCVDITGASL